MAVIDGSKVFIRNKKTGKYLLVLRDDKPTIPNPNQWSLIGGGIEDGETPRQAANREIVEELGIQVENLRLIVEEPVIITADGIDYEITGHLFLAETDKKITEMMLTEGQELRYFSLKEIEEIENLVPHLRRRIKMYRDVLENN